MNRVDLNRVTLTQPQLAAVRHAFRVWRDLRLRHDRGRLDAAFTTGLRGFFDQLAADVDHSALLERMLVSGLDPQPEPPVTNYSYPDYETGEVARMERQGDSWRLVCRTCEISTGWFGILTQEAKMALCRDFRKMHEGCAEVHVQGTVTE